MDKDKFHFKIPKENVKNRAYVKTGGGETVSRQDHGKHGVKLRGQTQKLIITEQSKKDFAYTTDLYLQISTPKDVTLKSQRLKIQELGFEVISLSSFNKSLGTARMKKEFIPKFEQRLDGYINSKDHVGKSYFSPIEEISSIPIETKVKVDLVSEPEKKVSIIINLFNILEPKERLAINGSILEGIKEFSEEVNHHNFVNGITSIECTLQTKYISKIISEFSTIKEIKPNHTFFIENAVNVDVMPASIKVLPVESGSTVCIIDSGISNANGIFSSILKKRNIKHLPVGSIDSSYNHGTFVASRFVFGDNIDDCLSSHSLKPYCYVMDLPVFGVDSSGAFTCPTEFGLRGAIEDVVVNNYKSISVYNLSLGIPKAIKDYEFTELAKLLDYLSKEYKVLFVIAAGNISKELGTFPSGHFGNSESRIGCPAESLLGLTVGSIAKFTNGISLSKENFISPFSRMGPGADLGVKPEVVAHGGNLIKPYNEAPRVSSYGISADGMNLSVDNGTSFSAPIISQNAQKLFDYYPDSDPNLVKGLLCHFAEPRGVHTGLTGSFSDYVGFGEPNIDNALVAGDNNAAYIYEGLLNQTEYQYVSFHVPDTLAEVNKNTKLKVKITVTYDPPVNPDNEMEYSKSRISAKLFKPTARGMKPITISGGSKFNLPWNPIIQFEQSFTRGYFSGGWSLSLRLYTRGNLADDYLQDYSVVIEVIDTEGGTNVYHDIEAAYGDLYKPIDIIVAA
jgi:hypothetical protein